MSSALQNSKYQSCIDACNDCFEACEFCATECLREEEVKMMSKCIQRCRDCANICVTASQFMSRDSEYAKQIFATFTLTYVMPAVLNVKNIRRWNIVNNVLKHVENVLENVVKWRDR